MKIAILGAGAYGTALGGVLAEKSYDIDYYDPYVKGQEDFDSALSGADMTLLAVPSQVVPETLAKLPKNLPIIVATKGIMNARVFKDFDDYMVLSGPGFADDIKTHKKTLLTATDQRILEMFTTEYLTFDFTDDENGVLMCGALKNVYAIGAGIKNLVAESVEWEQYIAKASEEMQALLSLNEARAETVNLACGIGDLKLTCNLPSRNYEFGQMLGQNADVKPEKTVEGVTTLKKIKQGEIKVPETAATLKWLMDIVK